MEDSPNILQPSISGLSPDPPFNTSSLIWPAFFGGIIGLAWVALANSSRIPDLKQQRTVTQLFCLVGAVSTIGVLLIGPASWFGSSTTTRLILRVMAVATAAGIIAVQRAGERVAMQRFEEPASMVSIGIKASVVGGLAQAALSVAILGARGIL